MQFTVFVSTLITDAEGRLLMVKEKKPKILDKLNLPGGHLEYGEGVVEGAIREAKEEACIDVEISGLVGLFTSVGEDHYLHFIFAGEIMNGGIPKAGLDHVKDVKWCTVEEIKRFDDEQMVSPQKYREAIERLQNGQIVPLEVIREKLSL